MQLSEHQDEYGNPIPVPVEVWVTFPPAAQAVILLLMARIDALEEQLRANSTNSSKPPSTDPPGTPKRRTGSSGRRPGGQPGHKGHSRSLLPAEKVTTQVDCYPDQCRKCGTALPQLESGEPVREQVVELPPIEPLVTEYRRHKVVCPCCATVSTGERPAGAPHGAFGPRLMALASMLTGRYRMSRRDVEDLFRNAFDVRISLGCVSANEARVSEALAGAAAQVHEALQQGETANIDDTTGAFPFSCSLLQLHLSKLCWREYVLKEGLPAVREELRTQVHDPLGIAQGPEDAIALQAEIHDPAHAALYSAGTQWNPAPTKHTVVHSQAVVTEILNQFAGPGRISSTAKGLAGQDDFVDVAGFEVPGLDSHPVLGLGLRPALNLSGNRVQALHSVVEM